jgi:hypothetical protein
MASAPISTNLNPYGPLAQSCLRASVGQKTDMASNRNRSWIATPLCIMACETRVRRCRLVPLGLRDIFRQSTPEVPGGRSTERYLGVQFFESGADDAIPFITVREEDFARTLAGARTCFGAGRVLGAILLSAPGLVRRPGKTSSSARLLNPGAASWVARGFDPGLET